MAVTEGDQKISGGRAGWCGRKIMKVTSQAADSLATKQESGS